ncbi:MAG: acyl carrier protein [Saprospiraceae bacterium]
MNIQDRVISMVSWEASISPRSISLTTSLKNDLNLDSIDLMLLILKLENWFNITLSNDDVENIETVKDAHDYINKYLS